MIQTAVAQTIATLADAEQRFNLVRTVNPHFFAEVRESLPALTEPEMAKLDRIWTRYRYHRHSRHLTEGVVNLLVLSPLLKLAEFYNPPFQLRAEVPVKLEVEALVAGETQVIQGRVDFLVIQDRLWLGVLESKGTALNLEDAIPQTLAYMAASPNPGTTYGMATNGGQFFFLKLHRATVSEYDLSDLFSLLSLDNRLYEVLQILKTFRGTIAPDNFN
jgi:hypothetical protein